MAVCVLLAQKKSGLARPPNPPRRTGPAEPCGSRRRCPSAGGRAGSAPPPLVLEPLPRARGPGWRWCRAREGCPCALTSIIWCRDLSNRSTNSARMLSRSISLREIMMRVRVLSSVPAPCREELEQITPKNTIQDPRGTSGTAQVGTIPLEMCCWHGTSCPVPHLSRKMMWNRSELSPAPRGQWEAKPHCCWGVNPEPQRPYSPLPLHESPHTPSWTCRACRRRRPACSSRCALQHRAGTGWARGTHGTRPSRELRPCSVQGHGHGPNKRPDPMPCWSHRSRDVRGRAASSAGQGQARGLLPRARH